MPLVERSEPHDDRLLREFVALVDALGRENGGEDWWGTRFASKNRFFVPVRQVLALEEERCGLLRRAWRQWVWVRDRLAQAARIARSGVAARRKLRDRLPAEGAVYVIKTFLYSASIRGGRFADPFFGDLAGYLKERASGRFGVLTVYTDFSGGAALDALDGDGGVVPLEFFLGVGDVLLGLVHVSRKRFFRRFRPGGDCRLNGKDVTANIARLLSGPCGELPLYDYLHKAAARNIARRYHLAGCAITFEGNPWERMFVAGLREAGSEVRVVGCQHAAMPPACAGQFPGPHEVETGLVPDVVFATGAETADMIREYGALPPERVRTACALRYGYLASMQTRERRACEGAGFRVLVALEGVPEAVDLVAYALDQAAANPEVRFLLRPHPLNDIPSYTKLLGVSLAACPNVEISSGTSVSEDIEASDALLYWGTTVCLEALMMGMPVIHFDRGDPLSYDPLFRFSEFKWTVRKDESVGPVVRALRTMEDGEYSERARAGRAYVLSYFHPVNDEALDEFMNAAG